MADSTTVLDTITEAQAEKATAANALFDAGSWALTFGRRASLTAALTWAYFGGRVSGTSVASGTLSLTASTTNFIVVHRTTLAVSVSVDGTNWCTPETYARLYKVVCGASGTTSYEDHRFGKWGIFSARSAIEAERFDLVLQDGTAATSLTTGTNKAVRRALSRGLVTSVRASLATVSSSGAPSFDVNIGGVSAMATNVTIDQSEKTNVTAAAAHVFCELGDVIDDDEEVALDCDTAGSSAAGAIVTLTGIRNCGDRHRDLQAFLLTGHGTNGATTFTDESPTPKTITRIGSTTLSTAIADPWGGSLASVAIGGSAAGLSIPYSDDVNFGGGRKFHYRCWLYNLATTTNRTIIDFRGSSGSAGAGWAVFMNAVSRYVAVYNGPTAAVLAQSSNNAFPATSTW